MGFFAKKVIGVALLSVCIFVLPNQKNAIAASVKTKSVLIVISGPPGADKTKVIKAIIQNNPSIVRVASLTTRSPIKNERNKKEDEKDDVDYKFISQSKFSSLLKSERLIGVETVHGSYFGILKDDISSLVKDKKDMIIDLTVDGAEEVKKSKYNNLDVVTIFILPKSVSYIRERLAAKGFGESEINRKMGGIMRRMSKYDRSDFVISGNTDEIVSQIESIYQAEAIRRNKPHMSVLYNKLNKEELSIIKSRNVVAQTEDDHSDLNSEVSSIG